MISICSDVPITKLKQNLFAKFEQAANPKFKRKEIPRIAVELASPEKKK
jgi:hypothetical protein